VNDTSKAEKAAWKELYEPKSPQTIKNAHHS
jgi:hypothetical protein